MLLPFFLFWRIFLFGGLIIRTHFLYLRKKTKMLMKNFAVVLAGAGKLDGNDLHEAVLLLAELSKNGAVYQCFAPNMLQHEVVNHYNSQPQYEQRNVLYEAARIARGDVRPLEELKASDFDGVCFPGGYGVAKNLCTFAFAGENYTVLPDVERVLREFYDAKKPIAALCIAPVLLAKVLLGVQITLGGACEAGEIATKVGASVQEKTEGEVCVDEKHLIYTTPCYMLDSNIAGVARGIEALVKAMLC